jgi:hypothetical protein
MIRLGNGTSRKRNSPLRFDNLEDRTLLSASACVVVDGIIEASCADSSDLVRVDLNAANQNIELRTNDRLFSVPASQVNALYILGLHANTKVLLDANSKLPTWLDGELKGEIVGGMLGSDLIPRDSANPLGNVDIVDNHLVISLDAFKIAPVSGLGQNHDHSSPSSSSQDENLATTVTGLGAAISVTGSGASLVQGVGHEGHDIISTTNLNLVTSSVTGSDHGMVTSTPSISGRGGPQSAPMQEHEGLGTKPTTKIHKPGCT